MPENSYKYFHNDKCIYFPCHTGADPERFNCLFCYCPLFALGDKCGGNPVYLHNGIKDCSHCLLPHLPDSYDYITGKFSELSKLASSNRTRAGD